MAKKPTPTPQLPDIITVKIDLRAIKWIETACRGNWWPFSGPWRNLPPSPPSGPLEKR